jgi:TonB family protein
MRNPVVVFGLAVVLAGSTAGAQTAPTEPPKPETSSPKTDNPKTQLSAGGVSILSDTQGVNFGPWLSQWHEKTERAWNTLMPDEVNPPVLKSGVVAIRFKVLPNGRLMDHAMVLEGRSGDVALDRAAWGAITAANYPPLPKEFHGPFLELRVLFVYNMKIKK